MQTTQLKTQTAAFALNLRIEPQERFHVIDIAERFPEARDILRRSRRTLLCSFHTTAGYLEQSFSARLHTRRDGLSRFFQAFRELFPEGAEYRHDQMELREELSESQRAIEPRNGDSHLTFISSGMKNCVTYRSTPGRPVYFIDLDGTTEAFRRERVTTIIGYDHEKFVGKLQFRVPLSRSPLDSVNLADSRFGLIEKVNAMIRRSGVEHGRVDIAVQFTERNAGILVNEYETLLMRHDLMGVLNDPLKFARGPEDANVEAPTMNPSFKDALPINQSSFERLAAKVMSRPARHFLRSRRANFLAASDDAHNTPRLLRGAYQSPILVQWGPAEGQTRQVDVTLTELY